MSLRMTDHIACFARGYKQTTGGSKGQADLYAQDLREAFVKVEYCESKKEALRMEHNYYQLHGSSGVLYNQAPPKHPRILVYNCLNDKTFVADSIREAARIIGADNANVGKAMHNNHTVKQHRFFAI
jgi:hypothetical protein